MMKENRT